MKRRGFLQWTAIFGTLLAAGKTLAEKITQGRCGAKCSQCDEQKAGKCDGCGSGEKAQCIVFKCNSSKNMKTCASCRANPCPKHGKINPPESART
jgi:hypothetical protein